MKKLKIALALVFAATLTLGIVACAPEEGGSDATVDTMTVRGSLSFNDAQNSDALAAAVKDQLDVTVRYEGERSPVKYDGDFTITGGESVGWGQVGTYYVQISPAGVTYKDSPKEVMVEIDHTWGEGTTQGGKTTYTCTQPDHAQKVVSSLGNVDITYHAFHNGVTISGNEGTPIQPAPRIMLNGSMTEVKSLTAGKLLPRSSITVKLEHVSALSDEIANLGEDLSAKGYYFPVIGFADYGHTTRGSSTAGDSIFIREEGWVLQNGVGSPRLLGGLAGGSSESYNYGSHTDAGGTKPANYGDGRPASVDVWQDYYSYSEGVTMDTDTYRTEGGCTLYVTWKWRADNIVELIYENETADARLIGRTKVPAGIEYFETLLHGDYCTYQATEITTVQSLTLDEIGYEGKKDADKKYVEGEMLNLTDFNISATYAQTGKQNLTTYDIEAQSGDNWVSLSEYPLSSGMTAFRATYTLGDVTKTVEIPAADLKDDIVKSPVAEAFGDNVSVSDIAFPNNGGLGTIPFPTLVDSKLTLTLSGVAQKLSEAQKAASFLSGEEGVTHYIAFRIFANSANGASKFDGTEIKVKNDDTELPASIVVAEDKLSADIVVGLKSADAKALTLTGLTEGVEYVLDCTGISGFNVEASYEGGLGALNEEKTITATYTFSTVEDGMADNNIFVFVNGSDRNLARIYRESNTWSTEGLTVSVTTQFTAEGKQVVLSIKKEKVDLANPHATYNIGLRYNGVDLCKDLLVTDLSFAEAGDAGVMSDHVYTQAKGGTIYVAYAAKKTDLTSAGIIADMANFPPVSVGTYGTPVLFDLTKDGSGWAFANDLPEDALSGDVYVYGTLDSAEGRKDTDTGYLVIAKIDVTKLEQQANGYWYDLGEVEGGSLTAYHATTEANVTTLASEELTVTADDLFFVKEGDCRTEGIVAYKAKSGEDVVLYGGAYKIGGAHKMQDGTCELCGMTTTNPTLTHADTGNAVALKDGQYYELTGKYNDETHTGEFNGIEASVYNTAGTAFYVRIRNDGYVQRETGTKHEAYLLTNTAIVGEDINYPEGDNNGTNNGTCIGKLNGITGDPIETAAYNSAKKSGSFRVYAEYIDRILTVTVSTYTADQTLEDTPYWTFTVTMRIDSAVHDTISFRTRIDNYDGGSGNTVDGKDYVQHVGYLEGSLITSVEAAAVDSHEAASDIDYSFVRNSITLTGKAKLASGTSYHAAFKISLSEALGEKVLIDGLYSGADKVENSVVKYGSARDEILVYIPIEKGETLGKYTLKLNRFDGSSKQQDISLDLTGVIASSTTVDAEAKDIAIGGGEFDLTFSGDINDNYKVKIGSSEKSIAELKTASGSAAVEIGEGWSVKGYDATSGTKLTFAFGGLTVEQLSAQIEAINIELLDENGKVATRTVVTPNSVGDYGTEIGSTGWHAYAYNGLLVLAADASASITRSTLPLIVNAGSAKTDEARIFASYELAFSYGEFKETNKLTEHATLTVNEFGSKSVAVIVIDVKEAGVGVSADNGNYGYMLSGEENYYLVSGEAGVRTIAEKAITEKGSAVTLQQHSDDQYGITAEQSTDGTFYFGLTFERAGAAFTENEQAGGVYVRSSDGAIKFDGALPDAGLWVAPSLLEGISENGLTVSFWFTSQDGDWAMKALVSGIGNMIVTMPNLDPWNNTLQTDGGTLAERRIGTAMKGHNFFPGRGAWTAGSDTPYNSKTGYATISLDVGGGISYYLNGEPVIHYAGTLDMLGGYTVGQFVEMYLGLIERTGFYVAYKGTAETNGLAAKDLFILKNDTPIAADGSAETDGATKLYTTYTAEHAYYGTDSYTDVKRSHGSSHSYTGADNAYCDFCGALNPDHTHQYDGGTYCKYCGALNPEHEHTWVNGKCSACGAVCPHTSIAGSTDTCTTCGMKRTKDESVTTYTPGVNSSYTKDQIVRLQNNQMIVFSAKFATMTTDDLGAYAAWEGIITQTYDYAEATPKYEASKTFQQGNNYCLNPVADWAANAVSGNANPLAGDQQLEMVQNRQGWAYEVTVSLQNGKLTIVYRAWSDGNIDDDCDYSGVATYDVTATDIAVGFAPDHVTFSDITIARYNLAVAD